MKTPPLNDLQRLITRHYAGGDYQDHECHIPGDTGDSLFDFVMAEADDDCVQEAKDGNCSPLVVLQDRIGAAADQLQALYNALAQEHDRGH